MFGEHLGIQVEDLRLAVGVVVRSVLVDGVRFMVVRCALGCVSHADDAKRTTGV
ncbi:hypothetical protein GCM10010094_25220 [Streptomyces flaveus]|uniref:Uncharacterized protein n=1 Tax=Streptomyces flaveus TaxID=66370 RepID=A0A917QR21_9ACTN|nr:hypothetical protein GCM10010094_25220 [Streptomyces flaveus]